MFTSAELIEALRRRTRRSLRPSPAGEFPPGWRDWFAAMAAMPGRVTGAPRADVLAAMAGRVPLPPDSRDERWARVAATTGSLLLHLLLAMALVWLMFVRTWIPGYEHEPREGEEHVLQVEYIGEGTPEDSEGGGAPELAEQPPVAPAVDSRPRIVQAEPEPEPPSEVLPEPLAAPSPSPAPPEVPEPPLPPARDLVIEVPELVAPEPPAPQELQVTVVDEADSRFALPPPPELQVEAPGTAVAEVQARRREIDVQAPPQVQVPRLRGPREPGLDLPAPASPGVAVAERRIEVSAPSEVVRPGAPRDLPELATRDPGVQVPQPRVRELPMPAGRPAQADAGAASGQAAPSPAAEGGPAPAVAASGGPPAAAPGSNAASRAPGAGALAERAPGALPSRQASDDWGDSASSMPGRQAGTPGASGLFDGDGRPRLADGGRVGGGLPPGTVTEDFENIDRHGTWLKRPPYDYEPTSFDRFWLPSESLLEEWVRKSITEVRIPIPGTSKTIRCLTVLLAVGGACDIVDPNLQEQPASARPPPDVPFKPELVEDQDALGQPPGG